jgi:hypothetical protein
VAVASRTQADLDALLPDWLHLLTDPDRKELARMIGVGERVTWPKVRTHVLALPRSIR